MPVNIFLVKTSLEDVNRWSNNNILRHRIPKVNNTETKNILLSQINGILASAILDYVHVFVFHHETVALAAEAM